MNKYSPRLVARQLQIRNDRLVLSIRSKRYRLFFA